MFLHHFFAIFRGTSHLYSHFVVVVALIIIYRHITGVTCIYKPQESSGDHLEPLEGLGELKGHQIRLLHPFSLPRRPLEEFSKILEELGGISSLMATGAIPWLPRPIGGLNTHI